MKKVCCVILCGALSLTHLCQAIEKGAQRETSVPTTVKKTPPQADEGMVLFTPPTNWRLAAQDALPPHVKAMVVGTGPSSFPPSMNLSSEPFVGSLKQYLKTVKSLNDAQGYEWKDLGTIRTEAGNASLSQVDTKSQWGDIRLMHVILIKNKRVYILTASALKEEFSIFYKDFFSALRSIRVTHDLYEMITDTQERNQLKKAATQLEAEWKNRMRLKIAAEPQLPKDELKMGVFNDQSFQESHWRPFQEMLKQKYGNLGPEWQTLFLNKLEGSLHTL